MLFVVGRHIQPHTHSAVSISAISSADIAGSPAARGL